jgi:7-cyano-7-deazaguanine synthase
MDGTIGTSYAAHTMGYLRQRRLDDHALELGRVKRGGRGKMTSGVTRTLVLMSGGIDSAACAALFRRQGFAVSGMFIDFGQAAAGEERTAIGRLSSHLGIHVREVKAGGGDFGVGEIVGRNAFLLTTALMFGGVDKGLIALGVHAGTGYVDCSQSFVDRMKCLVEELTGGCVSVSAPFISWEKAQIVSYARRTGLPIELTYSCESGSNPPCGTCASCRDRMVIEC